MKNLLLIITILFSSNLAFAQYQNSDVVGTYEGYLYKIGSGKDLSSKWKITISSTYKMSIWNQVEDLWIEQIKLTTSAKEVEQKNGEVYYSFSVSNPAEYKDLTIGLMPERMKKLGKIDGLYFILRSNDGNLLSWDMNKKGGNPKLKTPQTAQKPAQLSSTMVSLKNDLADVIKLQDKFNSTLDDINKMIDKGTTREALIKKHSEIKEPIRVCIQKMNAIQNDFVALQKEARQKNCTSAYNKFTDGFNRAKSLKNKLNNVRYSFDLLQSAKDDKSYNYYAKDGIWDRMNKFRVELQPLATLVLEFNTIYNNCKTTSKTETKPVVTTKPSSKPTTKPISTPKPTTTSTTTNIGLVIKKEPGTRGVFRVAEVKPGWAADKAGIKKGMAITYLNGKYLNTTSMTDEKVKKMLEGKAGTSLTIKFGQEVSFSEYKDYKLYRGENGAAHLIAEKGGSEKVGIGIKVMKGKGSEMYEVTWLPRNSSAYKAGVKHFDDLVKINGINISSKSESEVKSMLEGKKGSVVVLTVLRDGKEVNLTVVR